VKENLSILFFKKYLIGKRAGSVVRRLTLITLTAMTISVAALIIVMGVMSALNLNIRSRYLTVEPHLTLQIQNTSDRNLLQAHPLVQKIKSDPDLETMLLESHDIIVRTVDGRVRGAVAKGYDRESLYKIFLRLGKAFNKETEFKESRISYINEMPANTVLVGWDLASVLGVYESDPIYLVPPENLLLPQDEIPKLTKSRVERVVTTNVADIDAQQVFYIFDKHFSQISNSISGSPELAIWTKDPSKLDRYIKTFSQYPDVKVKTWMEKNSALFFSLKLEKISIGLFLTLASLISGFSLISLISLLISQKQKEISLLQVIGLDKKQVHYLFFKIGCITASIGLVCGLSIGSLLSFYLEKKPLKILPDIYVDSSIPSSFDSGFVLLTAISGVALSALASWIAAKSASDVDLSSGLRSSSK
jgi:lipoprotein-releasing system permease protein